MCRIVISLSYLFCCYILCSVLLYTISYQMIQIVSFIILQVNLFLSIIFGNFFSSNYNAPITTLWKRAGYWCLALLSTIFVLFRVVLLAEETGLTRENH